MWIIRKKALYSLIKGGRVVGNSQVGQFVSHDSFDGFWWEMSQPEAEMQRTGGGIAAAPAGDLSLIHI